MHNTAEGFREKVESEYGLNLEVQEFPEGTKTAEDAANAVGCEIGQIVKSIVMRADENIVVVLTSGENRVSASKLANYFEVEQGKVGSADPTRVKEETGWSIGGVPPFGHKNDTKVLMDNSLNEFEEVWAAAGTPKAVFRMRPEKIKELSGADIVNVFE